MATKRKKKKDGWFFSKSLLDEINELSEEAVEEHVKPLAETVTEQLPEVKETSEQKVFPLKPKMDDGLLQGLEEENKKLKENQAALEQTKQELLDKQAEITTFTKKLMAQKEQLLKERAQLSEELAKQKEQPDQQFEDQQTLEEALRKAKFELEAQSKQSQETLEQLNKDVQNLRNQLEQQARERQNLIEQNDILSRKIDHQQTTQVSLQLETELKAEKEALSDALYRAHSEIIHLQGQVEEERKLSHQVPQLKQELADQQAIYQSLKKQHTAVSQEAAKLREVEAEKGRLIQQLKNADEQAVIFSQQLTEKDQLIRSQREQLLLKEDDLQSKQREFSQLEQQVTDAQTAYHAEKDHAQLMEEQFYALQEKMAAKQEEVSKILLSAKKQGDETIQEAQQRANQLISDAKERATAVETQAQRLANELTTSKQDVLDLYQQLQSKVDQFARDILIEETQTTRKEGEDHESSLAAN